VNNINQSDSTVIKLTWYYAMKGLALYVFIYVSIDLVMNYGIFDIPTQKYKFESELAMSASWTTISC